MDEEERSRTVDLPFYEQEISPFLPPVVLDFHAHTWRRQDWHSVPWEAKEPGASYMVSEENYPVEALLADGRRIFPGRQYRAVCFGYPTPSADNAKDTAYIAEAGKRRGLYPLMVTGSALGVPQERLRALLDEHDTSMVMDESVLRMVFDGVASSRVLYATDFPVAAMRGRRVRVMDHWVDIVSGTYPASAYRVPAEGIRATFMALEIALAVAKAGRAAGLREELVRDVFFENGMRVLRSVHGGAAARSIEAGWDT
jgi:hypothetical protein